jgi:hypothetical protein
LNTYQKEGMHDFGFLRGRGVFIFFAGCPLDAIQPSKDLLEVPIGLVTRLRAKKFK